MGQMGVGQMGMGQMGVGQMGVSDLLKWIGSTVAMMAFLRGCLPRDVMDYIFERLVRVASPWCYFLIEEYDGLDQNQLYSSVKTYLGSLTSERALVSHLSIPRNTKKVTYRMACSQRILDTFNGVNIEWLRKVSNDKSRPSFPFPMYNSGERSLFEMRLRRAHKDLVLESYIDHITKKATELNGTKRSLRLYSNRRGSGESTRGSTRNWFHIPFRHPTTFDTIAMDADLKSSLMKDLDEFIKGKDFYKHVGKAWKRGYLLYGPPGTGKTSIVAAMANKLKYDIYDLELTEVSSNSELRNLLVYTESKSIIVIEDIDCSMDLTARRKNKPPRKVEKVEVVQDAKDGTSSKTVKEEEDAPNSITLSGLLNFLDGLWSCCESERIFVFTTNYVNKLDEALLRSGRMDMHISLSYIKFPAFKHLAERFLGIKHHEGFSKVEELLQEGCRIAPSEVAEMLMRHRDDVDKAMEQLIEALQDRLANPPPVEPKPTRSSTSDGGEPRGEEPPRPKNDDAAAEPISSS